MTLEEKIAEIRSSSMEAARAEGNDIIESYRRALEKVFEDHKQEAVRQMETRVKAETVNAKQQKNQAMAKAQLDLKRQEGRRALKAPESAEKDESRKSGGSDRSDRDPVPPGS